jgi:hypothetical protein
LRRRRALVGKLNREEQPTFQELEKLVKERSRLKKCAFEDGLAAVFRHGAKTVFRLVIFDAAFYVSIVVYVLLRYYSHELGVDAFPMSPIACVGSLAAFIVVFFTSQAWQRFMTMYNLAMGLEGRIFDITLLAQATLPPAAALMLWRHMNAAHALLYLGVSSHYSEENLLLPLNDLYKLLSAAEYARLSAVGFSGGTAVSVPEMDIAACMCADASALFITLPQTREVLSWAVHGVQAQYKAGVITHIEKGPLLDQITRFRATQGSLYDYQDLPFPFIYVSFVTVVCHLFPALFSATVALCFDTSPGETTTTIVWAHELIAFFAVFLNTCFFTGLHGIASKFQDPFENGPEDLSVLHFVRFTCQASAKVLLRAPPPALAADVEDELAVQRNWGPAMGSAFIAPAAAKAEAPAGSPTYDSHVHA